jgi:hypothetical protein
MTKFITLTKNVTVPSPNHPEGFATILPAGRRFKITDRDGIAIDGKTIFKRLVVVDGRLVDIDIPADAVTENTLENFKIN